jgi:predicted nucleic acid-binding protein
MIRKSLVIDANILIRAVLGRRVRNLIIGYAGQVDFFSPKECFDDARRYLPGLLEKRGIAHQPAQDVLDALARIVRPVETEWLVKNETLARRLISSRDINDWPILAAALTLGCPVWTEDADFFGVGVATWTTANVEHFFR